MTKRRSARNRNETLQDEPRSHPVGKGVPDRNAVTRPQDRAAARVTILFWIVAPAAVALVAAARIRLLSMPLERDEGEYAYAAQTILRGFAPFELAANMKLPGTDYAYSLILALFGQSAEGVHAGLLIANLGAVVFVFLIGRRMLDATAGLAAAAAYALMSIGPSVAGTAAHATHFVILYALAATWLLLRWGESRRLPDLILSGLCFGLAFLMKQPGVFFGVFGAVYVGSQTWSEPRERRGHALLAVGVFLFACLTPYALLCLLLWHAGVFDRFWFWTFTYARTYGGSATISAGVQFLAESLGPIIKAHLPLWLFAAAAAVLLWLGRPFRKTALFSTGFLLFSFLAVVPGFYFRQHYFILLLPAVALLAGAMAMLLRKWLPDALVALLFAGGFLFSVIPQSEFMFRLTPFEASRAIYGANPFPESVAVGEYLREHAAPDARIAVLGSEPQVYFYSQRLSASSHIYTYALMEQHPYALQMQNEMIADIEAARPEYVVVFTVAVSWLRTDRSPTRLFDWWDQYGPQNYATVGIVDIISNRETVYKWDSEAAAYNPRSSNTIHILKRKTSEAGGA